MCNALIDTGASRSCISEKFYKQPNLPPIQELFRTHVRSATGGSLSPLGTTQCTFHIGEKEFKFNFIVCKHLLRPVIIGADFLRQNHIFVGYSKLGQCVLEHKHMELVHSISINEAPILKMTRTVCVPARSIAVLNTTCKVDSTYIGQIYKTRLDHLVQNTHPNLITISAIHCMDTLVQTGIPLIVLNLGTYSIELLKDQVVGHLDNEEIDISEINTEAGISLDNDSGYESSDESDKEADPDPKEISSFIVSPADIETHRKVELKDKEIDGEYKKQFEELCGKYKDIFSADSTDIGKTPLLQMEIDTGNNPPICQKPYTLALKHAEWVKRELNILEKAGVIIRSVSPWASPIVIVPKRTAPGEPPKRRLCVDYRALNGLLPPVQKAHSKAKGILSLVPLPKIDEIYA